MLSYIILYMSKKKLDNKQILENFNNNKRLTTY